MSLGGGLTSIRSRRQRVYSFRVSFRAFFLALALLPGVAATSAILLRVQTILELSDSGRSRPQDLYLVCYSGYCVLLKGGTSVSRWRFEDRVNAL